MRDADGMMLGYSAQQIREAEAPLLAEGVPLMQRAAEGLAAEIRRLLPVSPARILFLIGPGNNGGDALYAAERLARDGHEAVLLPVASRWHVEGLAAALAAGARLLPEDERRRERVAALAQECELVVDGILGTGTGASSALRGEARGVVRAILDRASAVGRLPRVVAVDLPSGIDPDDGSMPAPEVLPAELTVTFGGCKAGLLHERARAVVGRIVLVDIGLGGRLANMDPLVVAPAEGML